jgi:hypothetical protein
MKSRNAWQVLMMEQPEPCRMTRDAAGPKKKDLCARDRLMLLQYRREDLAAMAAAPGPFSRLCDPKSTAEPLGEWVAANESFFALGPQLRPSINSDLQEEYLKFRRC